MPQILLVEDETEVRRYMAEALTTSGYTVIQAGGGKSAAALYNTVPIDLVITDLIMPDKDGLDLIMELRQNFPGVKILAISGGGMGDPNFYLEIAEAFGAQGILSKPFKLEELLDLVRKILEE